MSGHDDHASATQKLRDDADRDLAAREHDGSVGDAHRGHDPLTGSGTGNEHGAHDRNPSTGSGNRHEHGAHDHSGHDHSAHDHSAHDPGMFRRKFWLSLALTVPTMVFSTGLQDILGLTGPRFPGSEFIPAVFGTILFFYGGWVFITGGISEIRAKQPGMMALISLAIIIAFGYSIAVTLGLPGMDFWWEVATLITIMLLGHWIEMSAIMGAQNALGELAKLIPDEAALVDGDTTRTVPVADLALDDRVLVRPGSAVPVDGEVVDGESDVNESLLTGESTPVTKARGASVIAGSINGTGALTVRVTKLGEDTAIAGIMKLVADAQASKSSVQILADRAAGWLFYISLAAAIITAVVWLLIDPSDPGFILERVVTVLVIACPHALGLAIPLVAQISTSLGAKGGLLIRSRAALEDARRIDVVLFDKTGTLTEGRQGVTDVVPSPGVDADRVLALAASVEAGSEHPIARAIIDSARGQDVPRSTAFSSLAGRGAQADVDGTTITVGSHRIITERRIQLDVELVHALRDRSDEGKTVVFVLDGDRVLGLIALADVIRESSADAVARLKRRGIRVAMLTGDSHAVGAWVAKRLGIDEVFAEVLPGQKSEVVSELQRGVARESSTSRRSSSSSAAAVDSRESSKSRWSSSSRPAATVAMVGDGVNDAPALTQADVGIAIGAGTDVAIEAADIVLASSDPRAVAAALELSRVTYRKMQQNLFWAVGYNAVGIPLAAGVLAGAGILLSPALGAVLMSVSTIVVALNAQLLRRARLDR